MLKKVDSILTKAHLSDEVTELEKRNRDISLFGAREAIVLLENDGTLPLKTNAVVAMYGDGVTNTVKGGSGSGEVNERSSTSIYEGMKAAGFRILSEPILQQYQRTAQKAKEQFFVDQQKAAGFLNFNVTMANMEHPFVNPPFQELKQSDLDCEADTCIYVVSRISGEGYDRKLDKGDYYLTDREAANIHLCAAHYPHMILLINTGGPVDLGVVSDIDFAAVLYISMLGTAGGQAVAEVLSGKVNPSGHLTDTWALKYDDIPFGDEFSNLNGNLEKDYYKEGIYVGYRYYDTFGINVRYPFGHGLSYTDFQKGGTAVLEGNQILAEVSVTNSGKVPGKEVVQIYISCPEGRLKKERNRLAAFGKTACIAPGAQETLTIRIPIEDLKSYDTEKSEYVIEAGEYILNIGESVNELDAFAVLDVPEEIVVSKHDAICPPQEPLEEMEPKKIRASEHREGLPKITIPASVVHTKKYSYAEPEYGVDKKVKELMDRLTLDELVDFTNGEGNDMLFPKEHYYTVPGATGYSTCKYRNRGIADMAFCDGPAGLRFIQKGVAIRGKNKIKAITASIELMNFLPKSVKGFAFGKEKDGTVLYQFATAFPVGTALAQTWNTELVEQVGRAVGDELEEYGVAFWLGPGLNIHKNPLCGRNYEYYSEDPYLTGKIAAAITRGAQYQEGHSVSLKHFLCNNQEENRAGVSAVVSERALREIYMRGFEIAVKEGGAKGLMTSYNRVNGIFSAVNYDALTKVLRCEWGFEGIVMTDWDEWKEGCDGDAAVRAGVDIQMPGDAKHKKQIRKALKNGTLDEKYVRRAAGLVIGRAVENARIMGSPK